MTPSIDLELVRAALRELEDVDRQRSLWLAAAGPDEMGSFEEAVSMLFDSSGLGDLLEKPAASGVITETAVIRLIQLSWALDRVDEAGPTELLIEGGAMADVRRAATVARRAIFGED